MSNEMTKLQRLQIVLETYGATPASWPREDRELAAFATQDPQAGELLSEASALEQLLGWDAVPAVGEPENDTALEQRILADFTAQHSAKNGNVIAFQRKPKAALRRSFEKIDWAVPAALAACFAFGIYLGGTGTGDWTVDLVANLANLSGSEDQLADITDYVMSSGFEEDLL